MGFRNICLETLNRILRNPSALFENRKLSPETFSDLKTFSKTFAFPIIFFIENLFGFPSIGNGGSVSEKLRMVFEHLLETLQGFRIFRKLLRFRKKAPKTYPVFSNIEIAFGCLHFDSYVMSAILEV